VLHGNGDYTLSESRWFWSVPPPPPLFLGTPLTRNPSRFCGTLGRVISDVAHLQIVVRFCD